MQHMRLDVINPRKPAGQTHMEWQTFGKLNQYGTKVWQSEHPSLYAIQIRDKINV